ncbi:MAG: hypothetical protein Q4D85_05475 [Corynebacterium sp.]|uniref:hypothetical protein n=1 Tax=Corynebacterium sp. TaxID=1720 RepID=UPI0026DB3EE0|nr:hypothetical protein [Corynebacterium sp.]MDO5098192.1 hypothetical protein [Corynebacterium sp.]
MIPENFTAMVNDFIATLRTFASGDYLRDEDREFWDQPYNPDVLNELDEIFRDYLSEVPTIASSLNADEAGAQTVLASIRELYHRISAFNATHAYAVIEPEEDAEINDILRCIWRHYGVIPTMLESVPHLFDDDNDPANIL